MQKIFIAFFCTVFFSVPSYAYKVKTFSPLTQQTNLPVFQPMEQLGINQSENFKNENYPKITELEYNFFNKSFEKENIYSRLTRLENKIFKRNYSGLPLANRVENIIDNIDEGVFYGINPKDILKLEMHVLGRAYPNDDSSTRITRLEKEMLGAMQGGNLKERFDTVKLAAKHYNTYPEIAQNSSYYAGNNYGYYPQNRYTTSTGMGINGLFQNIAGKLFGDFQPGAITGYTPPIYDPYNQYPYGYSGPSNGFQEYHMGPNGGYYRNKNYGGNSSVKILN